MKTSLGTMIILQKGWDEGQITRKNSSSICTPKVPLYFMWVSTCSPSSGVLKGNCFHGTPTGGVFPKTQPWKSTLRDKQANRKGVSRNRGGMCIKQLKKGGKGHWGHFRCCWKWGWRGSSSSDCKSRKSRERFVEQKCRGCKRWLEVTWTTWIAQIVA